MKKIVTAFMMLSVAIDMSAADYYLSTTGSDTNDGKTREMAFATLGAAQKVVQAGDNVYILPGTYQITEEQISKEESPYKIVFNLNNKGQLGKPISFIGLTENGERPVFDMSQVNPSGYRVTAFYVTGCYMVFRNFEVVGVKVNITDHTQSENFRIRNGYRNTFDNIACHDGMGIGFYLTNNSHHNLFLNCDGYNNYDSVSEDGKGGQNDAFGCHVQAGNEENIFIGCRAWNNSDDGYDLINCYSPVTFCYSIAFKNGYDAEDNMRQDGNGFKAGGYGMTSAVALPGDGAPRHKVFHCLAVQNKSNGIYANHHLGGLDFTYNTAVESRSNNFAMVNRKGPAADENYDVNGYAHRIANNLSVSQSDRHLSYIDINDGQNTIEGNSFSWDASQSKWVNSYSATFASTNADRLKRKRLTNGMLDPATTLTVYQQSTYTGMGCDFSGYEAAVQEAKKVSGAEEPQEEVVNTYIEETTTWDFADLADGTIEKYTDYEGLVLRATAGTHAVTTKVGSVSFAANGANIETSYLAKNKQAADDLNNTTYDRCLAFNASVAGKTTVTFSGSDNDSRYFQILFKAKNKDVVKAQTVATKAQKELSLTSDEAGTFFIAATIACSVHKVKFEAGTTAIQTIEKTKSLKADKVYDLQGRCVGHGTWIEAKNRLNGGIYVYNGRKYIK